MSFTTINVKNYPPTTTYIIFTFNLYYLSNDAQRLLKTFSDLICNLNSLLNNLNNLIFVTFKKSKN